MLPIEPKVYDDGRTKQSFKEQTDINKILQKAARGESISHLQKFGGEYGDFTDIPDLLEANARLNKANEIFERLPGEIRREFKQDPAAFFAFVNDPANKDRLRELLPMLAKPGTQMPVVRRSAQTEMRADPVPESAPVEPPVEPPVE